MKDSWRARNDSNARPQIRSLLLTRATAVHADATSVREIFVSDHDRVIATRAHAPLLRCDFPPAASTTLPRAEFATDLPAAKSPRKRCVLKGLVLGCGGKI